MDSIAGTPMSSVCGRLSGECAKREATRALADFGCIFYRLLLFVFGNYA